LSCVTTAFAAALTLGVTGAGAVHAASTTQTAARPSVAVRADMRPQTPPDQCSAASYDGNPLLGPADLPFIGRVGRQLVGYQRTGGMSVPDFLATYRDAAGTGWIYPPGNGFVLDRFGNPVVWISRLERGTLVDRYGSVYGSFLAPEGTAYARRSIPPSNLGSNPPGSCNYHVYRVLRPFDVDAGRTAPWFAQPGGGIQDLLDPNLITNAPTPLNVQWLLNNGYLEEV
jgi:hypothetical protein